MSSGAVLTKKENTASDSKTAEEEKGEQKEGSQNQEPKDPKKSLQAEDGALMLYRQEKDQVLGKGGKNGLRV